MRVGVHLQALRPGKIGGLEGYVRQLVRLLPQLDPGLTLVLFCADYNAYTFNAGPGVEIYQLTPDEFARLDRERLRPYRLDLWFCPLLVLEPSEPGLPAVVCIPDLQHESFPGFFPRRILEWRMEHYGPSARRADAVLTLSRFSAHEIIARFGVAQAKVHAIHPDAPPLFARGQAEDAAYLAQVRARYALPEHFLYYPANNWPHKNHGLLFEALGRARRRLGAPLSLILTGAEVEGTEPWSRVLEARGLQNEVRYLGYVPLADLPGIYATSRALVFPSLFEGFGIPLVEAMRTGCPVVSSTAASLPEVGGDAALYFDPRRPDELADRILEVARERRSDLVVAGQRQARRFSWEHTAREVLDVFRGLRGKAASASPTGPRPEPPLISVVTPSFQQARYVERTLRSVLEQGYPRLEYWVIDGGSTDGTVEILERYRRLYPDTLHYVSEPDGGQAAAVNKGLARARGEILGWLNSDDTYEAGSLAAIARAFLEHPDCDVVYGKARLVSEHDEPLAPYPTLPEFDWHTLIHQCFLCQPTVFFRRAVLEHGYRLDEALHLCLDYDFWIRLGRRFKFRFLDRHLANSRIYPTNKTLGQRSRVFEEAFRVLKRHYGWLPLSWALGRAHYLRDHADPFFNERRVTWPTYLLAFLFLAVHNVRAPRHWPHVAREVARAITRMLGNSWRRVVPSRQRIVRAPASWLVVELGVEVSRDAARTPASVDCFWEGRRLASFTVNGPGRHARLVSLPPKGDRRPYRLVLDSELLRSGAARPLDPNPRWVAAEDGWLEPRDTLKVPAGWRNVELAFVLPATAEGGIRLSFKHRGRTVQEWTFLQPGDYRRRLRLPADVVSTNGHVEVDFASNTALPPAPERGEPRFLAMLVRELVEVAPGSDDPHP
jgi:glycosyltransferase involved in cell wall biosynthesis